MLDSLGICNLSEPFDSNMEALTDSTTFILPRDVGLQCCHLNKITIFGQELMDKFMWPPKSYAEKR